MTPTLADILAARRAIAGAAVRTALIPSPHLGEAAGTEVLLKLESLQPTGAFKLRGALNAVARLPAGSPGVTCASTGNHGRALAFAARARGLRAVVCMSSLVPATKVDAIRALGAEARIIGRSQDEAALESRRLADEDDLAEIPPSTTRTSSPARAPPASSSWRTAPTSPPSSSRSRAAASPPASRSP